MPNSAGNSPLKLCPARFRVRTRPVRDPLQLTPYHLQTDSEDIQLVLSGQFSPSVAL